MQTFFRENSNTVRWTFMDRASDGAYVNDATVTATLKVTSTDTAISGFSSVSLAYQSGSNGLYLGTVAASVFPSSLTLGAIYTLEITGVVSSLTVAFRKIPSQLIERTT